MKLHPSVRGCVDPLNNAMVEFYLRNQERFTQDVAPQYVYSPRELSRWVRAMYEAMEPLEVPSTYFLAANNSLRFADLSLLCLSHLSYFYPFCTLSPPNQAMTNDELVRLWAHEALRLFHDRLITDDEKSWWVIYIVIENTTFL